MARTKKQILHDERLKKIFFLVAALIVVASLIIDLTRTGEYVKDCVFILATIGLFYLLERNFYLEPGIIVIGLLPFILHLAGTIFNMFSLFIFGVGFDKYVHFLASASVTIVAFYWLMNNSRKHYVRKAFVALLITMGFGALNEVNEFVGYHYLHIYGATLFSIGDSLPTIASDLQTNDTQWDMIFNFFGASAAVLLVTLRERYLKAKH